MNCAECRDNLVACAEGLLDREALLECQSHLEICAGCRAEYQAITSLQQRLVSRGQAAAEVALVEPVMQRVLQERNEPEGETIMSKILKHRWGFGLSAAAGAAAIIIAVITTLSPKAFGIEQVIEAYNHVRFLHVKTFPGDQQAPNEFWIKADEQGRVEKARYYLPETEDGVKLITWTPAKAEVWFQSKHGFLILQTKRIEPQMRSLLEQSQPQLYMKEILEQQKAGKVGLLIQENGESQVIVATNSSGQKQVITIDKKTDLITSVKWYLVEGDHEVLRTRTEFSDYNVPIEDKMFELQDQLPEDVNVADQLTQLIGVPQGNLTDEQAAAETVRQFFQALVDKDYKKAGLIYGGELESNFKKQFGAFTVARIISVGPSEAQTNWVKRGFRVPCKVEIIQPDGHKSVAEPSPYVRPGDDEAHPDRWNITGGVSLGENAVKVLPDNEKYAAMTAEQTARAFFEACSRKDWNEAGNFMPYLNEQLKEYLGGLKIISVGESFTAEKYPGGMAPKGYPGRFVPYEIQLPPQEFNMRVSSANPAKRCVVTGLYDSKLKLEQDFKWSTEPEVLTNNDAYARLTPTEAAQAYFDAQSKLDWVEMRKFTSETDVETTKKEIAMAEKAGMDVHKIMPTVEVGEATWSPEQSAWFVKCRMSQTKKWNLALRKDNAAGRWQVDGGI
ncbi:MAG TPA: anti-sigma factor [Verrucomicrobiae bacterium]|nr:anti-sigma factor [Verrucomicrobiae bacterium]